MRRLTAIALLLLSGWMLSSAPAGRLPPILSIESQSGQFVVQGPPELSPSPGFLNSDQRTNFVRLDQARLAVLCERIKQSLLRELRSEDRWRGRIFVNLYRAGDLGEPIFVKAQFTPNGWFYHLNVPSEVEPPRLLRVMVAVLAQEMADRGAGTRPAELPPWLERGLAAQLETFYGGSFNLGFDTIMRDSATTRIERKVDPLAVIRTKLRGEMPLDLDGINWPKPNHLNEAPGGYYESCSQLMVLSLLRLPDGPQCLRRLVQEQAARNLNWQSGFLTAFGAHFKTLRDADKWWNLQVANFTGRDQAHTYTVEESWRKLEEILECPVTLKGEGGKTERGRVTLQTVIAQWEYSRQKPLMQQKIGQLQLLRIRVAPAMLRLVEDYSEALQYYAARRGRAVMAADAQSLMADNPQVLARRTVQSLNQLDILRAELKAALKEEARSKNIPPQEPAPLERETPVPLW